MAEENGNQDQNQPINRPIQNQTSSPPQPISPQQNSIPPQSQQPTQEPIQEAQTPKAIPQQPIQPQPQITTVNTQQLPQQAQNIETGQTSRPPQKNVTKRQLPPNKNKKILTGCFSALGCGFILFVIVVLIGIQQIGPETNPIAQALGVDVNSFVNILVLLVNLVFGIIAFASFIATLVGIFKAANSRKGDKKTKGQGMLVALISGIIFIIIVFSWFGIYSYLSSKRSSARTVQTRGIITEPKQTTNLTAPITIEFDATKIPFDNRRFRVLSINWDFGDSHKGTGSKISHEYTSKGETGRYTVTLNIAKQEIRSGKETTESFAHEIFISNEKVNAKFTATPKEGEAPLKVEFDASESKDPDGEIVEWEWDLNYDGQYEESGEKITHTFEKIGEYKVKLRVVDNNNEYSTTEETITVGEENIPKAVIESSSKNEKYKVGESYIFKADSSTSPNGKIRKYTWEFGDGTPQSTTRSTSHTYKKEGTYELTLTVTDEDGKEGEQTKSIKVKSSESLPTARISTTPAAKDPDEKSIKGKAPFKVKFSANKSEDSDGSIIDYKWDLDGDGTIDEVNQTTEFTFKKIGTYNATLTVIDSDGNEDTDTFKIIVKEQGLQARVKATPIKGTTPLTVSFDASASTYPGAEITSFEWNFGDDSGNRIDTAKVTHKYTKVGTFKVTATAIGDDNKRDTSEISINVRPVALEACFTPSRKQGKVPLTVIFDPRCSSGTISKYTWTFEDKEKSRDRKPTHTFTEPGTYMVKLEVSDNQNVLNVYEQEITATTE